MDQTERERLEQALEVHRRLLRVFGARVWDPNSEGDPVATLISTILSQNTNDNNRDVAFNQLVARFPTWEAVRDAPQDEVIEAIRPAGLAPTKGPRIQNVLHAITEQRGELSLDFLRDQPLDSARSWLLALDGVGPKTAAIVLLFALGRPAFPVDTHIHRVTRRLGLIRSSASREQAHVLLEALLPEELYFAFHLNIIQHGRTICAARKPQCDMCTLRDLCSYYRQSVANRSETG